MNFTSAADPETDHTISALPDPKMDAYDVMSALRSLRPDLRLPGYVKPDHNQRIPGERGGTKRNKSKAKMAKASRKRNR